MLNVLLEQHDTSMNRNWN